MSEENVEVARQVVDAWNRKDLDGFVALLHDDVEWHDRSLFPDAGVHRGRDEVARHLREIVASLDLRWDVDEILDAGESVMIAATLHGTGTRSGAAFEERVFAVAQLDGGMIRRRESYSSRAEALAAAGLAG